MDQVNALPEHLAPTLLVRRDHEGTHNDDMRRLLQSGCPMIFDSLQERLVVPIASTDLRNNRRRSILKIVLYCLGGIALGLVLSLLVDMIFLDEQ